MTKNRIFVILLLVSLLLLASIVCIYFMSFGETGQKQFTGNSLQVSAREGPLIDTETVLEFVYNYADGISETYYTVPATYMTGWDRQRVANAYGKWTIDSYSADRVVMHKNVDKDSNQHYLIKDKNGYVTVFYSVTGEIKEVTSANTASFSAEEREKYFKGFEVVGDGELEKFLQDIES